MSGSEPDISSINLDIMGTVSNDMNQWIRSLKAETVCKTHQEVTKEKLMKSLQGNAGKLFTERISDGSFSH